MSRPTILTVDDDPQVSAALTRDLKRRYGSEYRVLSATSAAQALELLKSLALRTDPVALIVSDQRMPEKTGIELLAESRELAPEAKQLLLTAYADTDVAITAINEIGLDYYLFKPWDPPEERLYPVVDDLLGDWVETHPDHDSELRVVGHQWSDGSYDVRMFLTRNHVPYRWLDVERDPDARQLVELAGATSEELPLVLMPDQNKYVLSQGLAFLAIQQGYANDYSALFAAMTITMIPTLLVYVLFQRRLESGLTAGALKG